MMAVQVARLLWRALELKVEQTYFFSDAEVALGWVRAPGRDVNKEVARKVQQVRIKTLPQHWRHVPGTSNPADLASRGESLSRLLKDPLWWEGPDWVTEKESLWPPTKGEAFLHTPLFYETVVRRTVGTYMARQLPAPEPPWEPNVAPTWEKSCKRAEVWFRFCQWVCKRAAERAAGANPGRSLETGFGTPCESRSLDLKHGWKIILQQSQKKHYPVEYDCLAQGEPIPA